MPSDTGTFSYCILCGVRVESGEEGLHTGTAEARRGDVRCRIVRENDALAQRIATLEAALATVETLANQWESLPASSVAYAFAERLRAALAKLVGGDP